MIRFCCKNCGHKYKVAEKYAGKKAKCKNCGKAILIPSTDKSDFHEKLRSDSGSQEDMQERQAEVRMAEDRDIAEVLGLDSVQSAAPPTPAEQSPQDTECMFCGKIIPAIELAAMEMAFQSIDVTTAVNAKMCVSPRKENPIKCYHCNTELPRSKAPPKTCPGCNVPDPLGVKVKVSSGPHVDNLKMWTLLIPRCGECCQSHHRSVDRTTAPVPVFWGSSIGLVLGVIVTIMIFRSGEIHWDSFKPLDSLFSFTMALVAPALIGGILGMVISFGLYKRFEPLNKAIKQLPPVQRLLEAGWKMSFYE